MIHLPRSSCIQSDPLILGAYFVQRNVTLLPEHFYHPSLSANTTESSSVFHFCDPEFQLYMESGKIINICRMLSLHQTLCQAFNMVHKSHSSWSLWCPEALLKRTSPQPFLNGGLGHRECVAAMLYTSLFPAVKNCIVFKFKSSTFLIRSILSFVYSQ